jgi:sporulation protein YlmC with PRC-barrel domain
MKQKLSILTGGLIAFFLPFQSQAAETPTQMAAQGDFGSKVKVNSLDEIKITTKLGEPLGRIQDLTLDLSSGRIVEVLVVSDQTLRLGGKTVAVPPHALIFNAETKAFMVDVSAEVFKAAPAFDLSKWAESTQPEQMAAAYHYFGKQPYFSAPGEAGKTTSPGAEFVKLNFVERMSKLVNMPVDNLQGEHLGVVGTIVVDVSAGNILQVFIVTNHFNAALKYSTIILPTLLSFNAKHDGLLLDVSKVTYDEEAHVIFQDGAGGQAISYREQPNTEQQAVAALVQGTSARDINTTAQIYKSIQSGKLDAGELVTVATLNGRVTLRGPVNNQATKDSIGAIATAATSPDNVENQIIVSTTTQASL